MVREMTIDHIGSLINKLSVISASTLEGAERIDRLLKVVGEGMGCDRIFFFHSGNSGRRASRTYQWRNEDLRLSALPEIPGEYERLTGDRESLFIRDTAEQPLFSDPSERLPRSLCLHSVYHRGGRIGLIGFEQYRSYREWSPADRVLADTLTMILSESLESGIIDEILEEKRRLLFSMLDQLGGICLAVDGESQKIIYANDQLESLYKRSLVGEDCFRILHNQETPCKSCKIRTMTKTETPPSYEMEIPGEEKTFLMSDRLVDVPGTGRACFSIGIDISERIRRERRIEDLVRNDPVTGLISRGYLEGTLIPTIGKEDYPLSVIMGDVNGLKMTNNVMGHEHGDQVLKAASRIFRSESPEDALISRWGGDEFMILLPRMDRKGAEALVEALQRALSREGGRIHLNISLGYDCVELPGEGALYEGMKRAEEYMDRHKLLESESVRSSIISSMRRSLLERSQETEAHASRLEQVCSWMADLMGLSRGMKDEIRLLATLHDIGKISTSDRILLKPGPLDEEEWKQMRQHSEAGYRILRSVPGLGKIAGYVLSHHERWDGSGYPQGLSGLDIPLPARILAVADTFDAITQDRPYRKGAAPEEALEEIVRMGGSQFDPAVVELFRKLYRQKGRALMNLIG